MKVLLTIPGDMTVRLKEMDLNLESMQAAVGGYIERVTMTNFEMWLNEDGKVNDLAVNEVATAIYQSIYGPNDVIVGPAIICGSNKRSVPKYVMDVIRAADLTIVQETTA